MTRISCDQSRASFVLLPILNVCIWLLAFPASVSTWAEAAVQHVVEVSPDGPTQSISEAVRQIQAGGTIRVRYGVYREPTIRVDKAVTIIGEDYPILDGNTEHEIMKVTADSVTIRGLEFRNVGVSYVDDKAGLRMDEVVGCDIENNRFTDTFFAIYLARTASCRVEGNTIWGYGLTETRSGNGIHLWNSKQIEIVNNFIHGHRDGIYFEFVEDSLIDDNTSEANLRYGLHFMFSDRCSYRNNVFRGNDAGVAVMYTANVVMRANRFENNQGSAAYGLLLKDISDSVIEDNLLFRNTLGIYMEGAVRNSVARNAFIENGWALKVMGSAENNRFMRNNFIDNTFDVSTNSRYPSNRFAENYWDAYRGYDLDRDGYGDVPFRPVRLFSLIVEHLEPAILLSRSLLVSVLDAAERAMPALTPDTMVDQSPSMTQW